MSNKAFWLFYGSAALVVTALSIWTISLATAPRYTVSDVLYSCYIDAVSQAVGPRLAEKVFDSMVNNQDPVTTLRVYGAAEDQITTAAIAFQACRGVDTIHETVPEGVEM